MNKKCPKCGCKEFKVEEMASKEVLNKVKATKCLACGEIIDYIVGEAGMDENVREEVNKMRIKMGKQMVFPSPIVQGAVKVGRNSQCPCGSGLKYKKCCL